MKLLLATTNPGKLREMRDVMSESTLDIVGLNDLDTPVDEPVEDGDSFEANALKKARHYAAASGCLTLAEDSGLEVDALHGAPGVKSARFAEVDGPREERDRANNRKLLEMLAEVPAEKRAARFVCVMALVAPPGTHFADVPEEQKMIERGVLEGRILTPDEAADPQHPEKGRGTNGFGYDPLFLVPDLGKTTAEMEPSEKNDISHRGQATVAMWKRIHSLIAAPQG